jgi:hypothetical protein
VTALASTSAFAANVLVSPMSNGAKGNFSGPTPPPPPPPPPKYHTIPVGSGLLLGPRPRLRLAPACQSYAEGCTKT